MLKLVCLSYAFHVFFIRLLHVKISVVTAQLHNATSAKLRRKTVESYHGKKKIKDKVSG